ncbi:hypothetical protein PPL_04356 [Heterostelium album PN500]|uniref:Spore coat protein U domain-containing protein n=1 Tax=Heterostelium pallidum (strain ATCC 26659 / Pp 5 / PN500) TaxID=670386 RepID=D3B7B9_HETP5|nr:hypothetical protein PPL_04356 [Heterostelium album PN500]EFA82662.1 hypothetical protein PPL_04356 [Heterostelium album PN500]|eukprot:XP_020434779.1 hypothetical protein PPL_04356 [Heterostelium album PN500]
MNKLTQALLCSLLFVAIVSATDCGYYCTSCCDVLTNRLIDLENRVTVLENSKVKTISIASPIQNNIISSTTWTLLPGTTTNVEITRPSNLIANIHTVSHSDNLGTGAQAVDITGFLNGYLMSLGNPGTVAPTGLGIDHTLQWSTTPALNQQYLSPGNYTFDIRSRLRGSTANPGEVNNPGAVLFIVPL